MTRRGVAQWAVGFGVFGMIGLGAGAWWTHGQWDWQSQAGATLDLSPGQALPSFALELEARGVIRSALALRVAARARGSDRDIGAGRYQFDPGMRLVDVLTRLEVGEVLMVSRTIPEGLTIPKVAARLFPEDAAEREEFVRLALNPAELGISAPPTGHLEGYLFPDTYRLPDPPTAAQALGAMCENGLRRTSELRAYADSVGTAWHQVLAMAAIVEGEATVAGERAKISGVYHNRLRRGMLLQADPTVAYATGKIGERLFYRDLEVDSPYNTYRYAGLPPGPINNPGLAAMEAALQPESHQLLYFVHRGDGTHEFSRTHREHLRAVRRARENRRNR